MNPGSQTESLSDIDSALLDAELFLKYQAPERAIKRLRTALERSPRALQLRERLREIAAAHKHLEEAARQCLALASLYIEREEFDTAYDRLLEAKQLDPRINIAAGLEAIRRARRPEPQPTPPAPAGKSASTNVTLAGDLAAISVFDAIQVIENAKLNGVLTLSNDAETGHVLFNAGAIVDADCAGEKGEAGFGQIVEITSGVFEFQKTTHTYPVNIQASSNTNLILDALRRMDEDKL
jgi:tetratricopeptide (TPR) repeat protein